jgi:pilus assembly protein CpaF
MRLSDRLKRQVAHETTPQAANYTETTPEIFQQIKSSLQARLIDELNLSELEGMNRDEMTRHVRPYLERLSNDPQLPLNRQERLRLVQELLDEMLGLGPLEPLLADAAISDILVNGPHTVYVERRGRLERVPVRFRDNAHLLHVIQRIVSRVGRRVDESTPMVDARLQDGSRVNAIIPPLALDGPSLSIRRFGAKALSHEDLLKNRSIMAEMVEFVASVVRMRANVLVSGGTGTGKTTFLNMLSSFIPNHERVITIEDSAELRLQQEHVVRLETRPPNIEGKGEVTARMLVKNALRMRPERIIIGEIRGEEIIDMLQAMNTGHDGSMATIHANTPRDAMSRAAAMMSMSGIKFSEELCAITISRALNFVIQLERGVDGGRRCITVAEVGEPDGPTVQTHDVFTFQQETVDENGRVRGTFRATGYIPKFLTRLEQSGIRLSRSLFQAEMRV